MPPTRRAIVALLLAAVANGANAEVTEISVAQQYGVSFLPLMVMEREKLVEKHAKALGLPDLKANWVSVAGPSVMNDGVISGAIQFIAVGAPSLITLWDKTKNNVQVKGVQINAEGTAAVAVKGANVSVNANATAELKGGAMVNVQGALVKIN